MVQQHKTCTKCGETKPIDGFHKDRSRKDGMRAQCKPCTVESNRRYYEANLEEIAERKRRHYEANRDEMLEQKRRHYGENRDEMLEQKRRYYEENRDEIAERQRRYYEENRNILSARNSKSYREAQKLAAKLATVPPHTPWTPGEDAFILADNGMTLYQKAVELGRTLASAMGRRQVLLAKLNA